MPRSLPLGRIAAVLALAAAAVVLVMLFTGGSSGYKVTAEFENASQLVNGNLVEVAGVAAGKVKDIKLGDDGQALVEIEVADEYAPLPANTKVTVRSQSLSGIANRYVSLEIPAGDQAGPMLDDGGVLPQSQTVSEVDLDEIFNTLDEKTVNDLKSVIKGFARSYEGVGKQANEGFYYLNPFLSTSRRVFGELTADQGALENLIVDGASLTDALAQRSPDIEALIGNLNRTTTAIGNRETELADAIGLLPGFLRQFDTTSVNLRAALDDVDPLVIASRPVALKLQPFARNLRGFARDAVPTIVGLDGIVKRRGKANDLIELTKLQVPLARIGVGPVTRNGASREGALPASTRSLDDSLHQLEFFRPYTSELVGWFDDFGHSGVTDSNGGIGRIATTFNTFTPSVPGLPPSLLDILAGPDTPSEFQGAITTEQRNRCPGANERNPGGPYTDNGALNCDPSQVPTGP